MIDIVQGVLAAGVRAGTPILYAMLGEIVTERAGVVNLGADGAMLMGACVGFITAAQTQDPFLGILAAAVAGAAISLLHAFMVVTLRANQIASGLALTFLSLGITSFIGRPYVKIGIEGVSQGAVPYLSEIPFIGPVFFRHDILVYGAYLLALLIWFFLFYTRGGLVLRTVGENSDVAFALGIKTKRVQYLAVAFGGMCAGLAGAHLSLAYTRTWVEGMTNGRGIIAVALVIFSAWHPFWGVVGAVLFGATFAFQLQLQARGITLSPYFLDMLPYLFTLFALLVGAKMRRHAMPEGIKKVFEEVG
jgi:simple sugar transport system permease protein